MNHNIPSAAKVPADEKETMEKSSRPLDQVAVDMGSVALFADAESQVNPTIEHMKKVEQAFFGSPDNLLKLVDEGEIGVDDTDFEDRTAVMMMTARGHKDAVEVLIASGANVNRYNMYQGRIPMSALDAARQTNRSEIEQLLLDNGAKSGRELLAEQVAIEQSENE